jgi:gas vesicle protein
VFGQIDAQTALITIAILALTGVFRGVGLAIKGVSAVLEGLTTIFGTTTGAIAGVVARVLLLQGLLRTLVQDMVKSFGEALDGIKKAFETAVNAISGFFQNMGKVITDIIDTITGAINAVIDLAKQAIAAVQAALGGGGDSGSSDSSFARGGMVRGPGTGTSDSILARLSNGEFVMTAKAVRRLGVGFLNSLNAGRANGFALGGLVGDMRPSYGLPAFAEGGLVGAAGSRTPITLNIGGEEFADLLAPDDVADKLVQFAMGRKVRSGGKKPSWKKS